MKLYQLRMRRIVLRMQNLRTWFVSICEAWTALTQPEILPTVETKPCFEGLTCAEEDGRLLGVQLHLPGDVLAVKVGVPPAALVAGVGGAGAARSDEWNAEVAVLLSVQRHLARVVVHVQQWLVGCRTHLFCKNLEM